MAKGLILKSNVVQMVGASDTLDAPRIILTGGGTAAATLKWPFVSAPTTPSNGDMWADASGLYYRNNGTTVTLTSPGGGGITAPYTLAGAGTGTVPFTINAANGQTSNIQNWQVNGATLASISKDGYLTTGSFVFEKTGGGSPQVTALGGIYFNFGTAVTPASIDVSGFGLWPQVQATAINGSQQSQYLKFNPFFWTGSSSYAYPVDMYGYVDVPAATPALASASLYWRFNYFEQLSLSSKGKLTVGTQSVIDPKVADSATAVAHIFNAATPLVTSGSKILEARDNGASRFFIRPSGELRSTISSGHAATFEGRHQLEIDYGTAGLGSDTILNVSAVTADWDTDLSPANAGGGINLGVRNGTGPGTNNSFGRLSWGVHSFTDSANWDSWFDLSTGGSTSNSLRISPLGFAFSGPSPTVLYGNTLTGLDSITTTPAAVSGLITDTGSTLSTGNAATWRNGAVDEGWISFDGRFGQSGTPTMPTDLQTFGAQARREAVRGWGPVAPIVYTYTSIGNGFTTGVSATWAGFQSLTLTGAPVPVLFAYGQVQESYDDGDLLVGIVYSGGLSYSTDYGNSWTAVAVGGYVDSNVYGYAGVNAFGALASNGTTAVYVGLHCYTSTNLTTWALQAGWSGPSYVCTGLVWSSANNLFIATAQSTTASTSYIRTSTNGVTWTTQQTATAGAWLKGIVNSGTLLLAYANNSATYYTSTNGTTWTARTAPTPPNKILWISSGGYFLFYAGPSVCYTSTDGINWTSRTVVNAPASVANMNTDGVIVVIAPPNYDYIYTSLNGWNWSSSPVRRNSKATEGLSPVLGGWVGAATEAFTANSAYRPPVLLRGNGPYVPTADTSYNVLAAGLQRSSAWAPGVLNIGTTSSTNGLNLGTTITSGAISIGNTTTSTTISGSATFPNGLYMTGTSPHYLTGSGGLLVGPSSFIAGFANIGLNFYGKRTASDIATDFVFDSNAATRTNGYLFSVRNNAVEKLSIDYVGNTSLLAAAATAGTTTVDSPSLILSGSFWYAAGSQSFFQSSSIYTNLSPFSPGTPISQKLKFSVGTSTAYFGDDGTLGQNGPITFLYDSASALSTTNINYCLQSQALATSPWNATSVGATVPSRSNNLTTAPDGTTTATTLIFPAVTAAQSSYVYQTSGAVTANLWYTFSVWLRSSTTGTTYIFLTNAGAVIAQKQVSLNSTTWQRVSISVNVAGTGTVTPTFAIGVDTITSGTTMTAQSAITVYAWGAQFEQATAPERYQPTTTIAVSKNPNAAHTLNTLQNPLTAFTVLSVQAAGWEALRLDNGGNLFVAGASTISAERSGIPLTLKSVTNGSGSSTNVIVQMPGSPGPGDKVLSIRSGTETAYFDGVGGLTVSGTGGISLSLAATSTTFGSYTSSVYSQSRATADQTWALAGAQSLTNLAFYAQASGSYEFEFVVIMSVIGSATGTWTLTGPASPTWISAILIGPSTTIGALQCFSSDGTGYPSLTMTTGKLGIWRLRGIFVNGVTAGTVQLNFNNQGVSSTVKAQSFVVVRRIA